MKQNLFSSILLLILGFPITLTAQFAITTVSPTNVQQGYQGSLTITTSAGQPFAVASTPYILQINQPSSGNSINNNSWSYPSSNTSITGGIMIPSNANIGTYDVSVTNWTQFGPTTWAAAAIFEITPLVSIDPSNVGAVKIGPNPVLDKLILNFPDGHVGTYQASLHNIDGRLIRNWEIEIGTQNQFQLDFQGLANGHYFLQVKGEKLNRSFRVSVQN